MMPTGLHYVGDKMLMIHLLCCRTWTQSTSVVYQKRLLASASCVFPLIHERQFMRTAAIMFFRTIALLLSSSTHVVYLQHVSSADNVHNVVTQCRIYTTIRCNQSRSAASSWHIRQHEDITDGMLKMMNQQNKDIFGNCNWCAESKIVIITINNSTVTGPTVSSAVSAVQDESIYTVSFTACFTETPPACKCSIRGLSPIWIRGPGSAPPQKIRLRTTVHWTPHKRYLSLFSNKRVTPVLYNILVIDNINWLIIGKVWAVSTPPYCFGGMGLNSENHDFDCDITGQSAVTWPVI